MEMKVEEEFEVPSVPAPFKCFNEDKTATRRRQALFLRQALRIIERFAYNPVTPDMLAAALPWLERAQYDDIAVERNSYDNCGYALCPNCKGKSINQHYRIDTHTRKVYDTTKRKPFCSDWCFQASYYVRKQISKEPAWCRSHSTLNSCSLKLLHSNARGNPGKLVLDALNRLTFSQTSSDSNTNSEPDDEDNEDNCVLKDEDNFEHFCLQTETDFDEIHTESVTGTGKIEKLMPQSTSTTNYNQINMSAETRLIDTIKSRLYEWMTTKALNLINSNYPSNRLTTNLHPTKPNDPLCDAVMKQFYYKYNLTQDKVYTKNRDNHQVLSNGVIPLIDSISPDVVRRIILWDNLKVDIEHFLHMLNVDNHHAIKNKLDLLIQEFNLTSKNTHLKCAESRLMSLILLRLLALTEPKLSQLLDFECFTCLLKSINGPPALLIINCIINPTLKLFSVDSDDDIDNV